MCKTLNKYFFLLFPQCSNMICFTELNFSTIHCILFFQLSKGDCYNFTLILNILSLLCTNNKESQSYNIAILYSI